MSVLLSTSPIPFAAPQSRQNESTSTHELSLAQLPAIEVSDNDSLVAPNPSSRSSSPTASPVHREHSNPLDSNASMIIESEDQSPKAAASVAEPLHLNSFASGPRFAVIVTLEQDESPPSELVEQEISVRPATTPDFLGQLQINQADLNEAEAKQRTPSSKHSTPVTTIISGQAEEENVVEQAEKTPSPKANIQIEPPAAELDNQPGAPIPVVNQLATIDEVVVNVAPDQDKQLSIEAELQDAIHTPIAAAPNQALRPIEPRQAPAARPGICSQLFGFCFGKK